jgi:hypothetical protein
MKRPLALSAALLSTALAAPAFAGPSASLTAAGRTIAGPGTTTLAASAEETVVSGIPGSDACATVTNSGSSPVQVTVAGTGSGSVVVNAKKTLTLCRENAQSVTLLCQAVGNGSCSATWRVDDL